MLAAQPLSAARLRAGPGAPRGGARALLAVVALALLGTPGCVIVPRYAREHVTDPAMDRSADALESRELGKLHWAREGAAGGDGAAAGGGCACGT